jgi:hypothetical protein
LLSALAPPSTGNRLRVIVVLLCLLDHLFGRLRELLLLCCVEVRGLVERRHLELGACGAGETLCLGFASDAQGLVPELDLLYVAVLTDLRIQVTVDDYPVGRAFGKVAPRRTASWDLVPLRAQAASLLLAHGCDRNLPFEKELSLRGLRVHPFEDFSPKVLGHHAGHQRQRDPQPRWSEDDPQPI